MVLGIGISSSGLLKILWGRPGVETLCAEQFLLRLRGCRFFVPHIRPPSQCAGSRCSDTGCLQVPPNLFPARMRVSATKLVGRQNHTRGAETALQAVLFPKAFLQWMEFVMAAERLNGCNFAPIGLHGKQSAGFYGFSIQQYRACPAERGLATNVSPRESSHIAQVMDQQQARLNLIFPQMAIDLGSDFHRQYLPLATMAPFLDAGAHATPVARLHM